MQLHGAGSPEITRDHPRPSPPSLPRETDEPALWTGDASFGHYLADVQRARGAAEYWERYDDTAVTRRAAMSPPRQRYAPLENDTDPEAQEMILEQFVAEAQSGRQAYRLQGSTELLLAAAAMPTPPFHLILIFNIKY